VAEESGAPLLRNVSDTALWVAVYRAEETDRRDALFHDPFARRLAGPRGFELIEAMPKGRTYAWPMVVRTVVFDRFLADRLSRGTDVVLNLAAGLDARPYRMTTLPKTLKWVEVDLPDMVDYKTAVLADETPVCSLERIAADLSNAEARRKVFADVGARGKDVLVLTEGLLIYLEPAQVAALADDLAAVPSMRSWITDLSSPGLLKMMMKTWGKTVQQAGAPFLFAPEEGPAFFEKHGWRVVKTSSSFREAANLRRLKFPLSLFAMFPDPKTWKPNRIWGGSILLERAKS
jgi:methyltransferase (TIGR00027 family)